MVRLNHKNCFQNRRHLIQQSHWLVSSFTMIPQSLACRAIARLLTQRNAEFTSFHDPDYRPACRALDTEALRIGVRTIKNDGSSWPLCAALLSDYQASSLAGQTGEKLLDSRRRLFYRTDCKGFIRHITAAQNDTGVMFTSRISSILSSSRCVRFTGVSPESGQEPEQ